jgi:Rrf2 family protein
MLAAPQRWFPLAATAALQKEKLMKLTRASLHALHALAHLAEQDDNHSAASHDIAKARGIPDRFLPKVLKPLAQCGILASSRGPGGGYRLAKPATKITLLEAVEAVEGPLHGYAPAIEGKGTAPLELKLQALMEKTMEQTRQQLQAVTVADLASKAAKRK